MDRFVMRQRDTGGVALIPESSVVLHRGLGWLRVSDAIAEEAMHGVDVQAYADAPDLDAEPEPDTPPADEPATEATPRARRAQSTRES